MVYKGVTKKYIRVAIQRLVLILPVEEQVDLKAVGADEVAEAEEAVGMKEEVKKVPTNASKKSSIAAHSLKCRYVFNSLWEEAVVSTNLPSFVDPSPGMY